VSPFRTGSIEIWCDFNVAKMVWLFVSRTDTRAHVFAELVREDTDTMQQTDEARTLLALWMSRDRSGLTEDEIRRLPMHDWPVTPEQAARRTTVKPRSRQRRGRRPKSSGRRDLLSYTRRRIRLSKTVF
jgi:hypothetical protein